MPTCLIVLAVVSCVNLRPLPPADSVRVLAPVLPIYVATGHGPTSHVVPHSWPAEILRRPPTQWRSVTTFTPRYGPPVTMMLYDDGTANVSPGYVGLAGAYATPTGIMGRVMATPRP
jgi:hypothetical protein